MNWNWQLPDWPKFTYNPAQVEQREAEFLLGAGKLLGAITHLGEEDSSRIRVELLRDEAWETSRIEGELLNRDSLQSSLCRHFGLPGDARKVTPAELGVSKVLVDAYHHFAEPLTIERLCKWHASLMQGRVAMRDVGKFRTGSEPMRIVSGPVHDPRIHFEAVPSDRVLAEMEGFLTWFNHSRDTLPALARAALAHVRFESIHPYEDGNGRIGRVIAEIALSQALGKPALLALSRTISARKSSYYAHLEQTNRTLEITPWVDFFADTVVQAQRDAGELLDFVMAKARFFDQFRDQFNARQEKVLLRIFTEGPEGFAGGLSAGNYQRITKASPATSTRDLSELVKMGALAKTGDRKHARYSLRLLCCHPRP